LYLHIISAAQHRVDLSKAKKNDLMGYFGIKFISKEKKAKDNKETKVKVKDQEVMKQE
jgi:hypothetical protein